MNYWPHGAPYYYQYRNNVWPVNTFTKALEPYETYATVGNNPNYWLLYIINSWSNNATLGSVNEGYGPAVTWGNMTWLSQAYVYDHLNRLASATDSAWLRNFGYDEYGNVSVTGNSNVFLSGLTPVNLGSNPYNPANNRLLSSTYDSAGNTKQVGSLAISYDAEGEQTQTYDSTLHVTASYVYDADGQRVQKAVTGGATISYVHDVFGQLLAEYTTAAASTPPCTTCYLSYDHLGSVRLVTDQNANIVSRHDFLPFGEEIANGTGGRSGNQFAVASGVNQKFTGQERDSENAPALDFFNARYMSAVLGSFTRPDPYNVGADIMNPQSWNGYTYVSGNPLGFVDPSGTDELPIPVSCHDCTVTVNGGSPDPIDLFNYWSYGFLDGYNPNSPLFTVTGTGAAYRNPQLVSTLSTATLTFPYINPDRSITDVPFLTPAPQSAPCSYTAPSNIVLKAGVPAPSAAVHNLMFCVSSCMGGTTLRATSTSDSHGPTDPHTQG